MRSSRIVVAHMKFYIMSYSCHPSLRMLLVRTVPLLTTSIFWRHRTTCNYGDSRSNIRTGRQVVCHGQFHFQVQRLHDLYLCPKTEGWFHVCHTTLLPVYKIVSSSCKQTKHEHPSQTSTSVSWNASSHRNITSPILSTLWTSKGFLWRDWMHYPAPSHQYILYVNVPKGSVDPSTSYYCQQSRLRDSWRTPPWCPSLPWCHWIWHWSHYKGSYSHPWHATPWLHIQDSRNTRYHKYFGSSNYSKCSHQTFLFSIDEIH